MTENDAEFYSGSEEPDLEEPEDGRESYPPVEGSSDEPETLDAQDPYVAPKVCCLIQRVPLRSLVRRQNHYLMMIGLLPKKM